MPHHRDDPDAPPTEPPGEPATSDDVAPVTDEALLRWARQFIEEIAAGKHRNRDTLDDQPFERHVALAQVVPGMLRDRRPTVRRAAAWVAAAADVHDDETIPLLAKLLRDRVALVRMAAAWACGELAGDAAAAVPALVAALRDPNAGVRLAAACALGQVGDPAAVPALLALADAATSEQLRFAAVKALGEIAPDHPEVRDRLVRELGGRSDDVRFAAAYGLAHAGSAPAEAAPGLTANLASADPYLVTVTAWAVGKLADAPGQSPAPALLGALRRMHWLRVEHNEEPGDEFVSIRPVLGEALRRRLPGTDDPNYEDFRVKFFVNVFRPAPPGDNRWIDEIVTHPWYLRIQRRRFGHPASRAERAAVREMVREAQAKFAERVLKNPTLGVTPDDYARLPGFIKNHCRNIAWRLRERRRKERARRAERDVAGAADPSAVEDRSPDGGIEVLEIIQTYLPPEEREVARLVLLLDYTIPEAAALLNLTPSQVKTRLAKARRRLADRLR